MNSVRTVWLTGGALAMTMLLAGCSTDSSTPTPTSADSCERAVTAGYSAYELWISQGNKGTIDDFFAALVGEKGADGYSGFDGVNGKPGATGPAGASAYQIWLDQGNTGTPQDFLNSIAGATGTAGLSGLSAYQLWLSLGNTGTTQDFIDSLKGETGATGSTGPTGAAGAQGIPGICTVGDQGIAGPAGPVGPIGPSGSPGPTGATGAQGPQGIQGPQGETGPVGPAPSEVAYTLGGGTISGTQPTFNGAPMFYGAYVRTGATVYFNVTVVMTNITNFGTGQYYVTLPFPSKYGYSTSAGRITDTSSGHNFSLNGYAAAGSNVLVLTYDSGSQQVAFDHNSPVTLTPADVFVISGTYIPQ